MIMQLVGPMWGKRFRVTWAMLAATRSNGAGTVGSGALPVAVLPPFDRKG